MFLLRIVGLLVAIVIGSSLLTYLLTADRRYLRFAGRVTRYALIFVFIVLALLAAERLLVL